MEYQVRLRILHQNMRIYCQAEREGKFFIVKITDNLGIYYQF